MVPSLCGRDVSTTVHSCVVDTDHSLEYLQIRDIALNDLSAVYGASGSFTDSTDNLMLVERTAM